MISPRRLKRMRHHFSGSAISIVELPIVGHYGNGWIVSVEASRRIETIAVARYHRWIICRQIVEESSDSRIAENRILRCHWNKLGSVEWCWTGFSSGCGVYVNEARPPRSLIDDETDRKEARGQWAYNRVAVLRECREMHPAESFVCDV